MRASHFRSGKFVVIAIVCLLLIGAGVAQTLKKDVKSGKEMLMVKQDKNPKLTPGLDAKIESAKADEELSVIIFFKKKDGTEAAKTMAQSAAVYAVEAKGGKVKHRYALVDAVSAMMTAGRIEELAASGDIERIYYDEVVSLPPTQPVKPALSTSTQTIGANYVWETLGYTGTGIKVAVIDTGINYSHPDLGGGFGSGKKVASGYDFANNDPDPMDDHGHGTHVAGTVAANGSIKGVAPNATLFAVKVLNSAGSGSLSSIIAGIDWSVANGADIISMSLGGTTQPTDEFESVLNMVSDAAVDKGVVVVVAAGNSGPGTGTIAYPGSSRKVITVGASDDKDTSSIGDDTIAPFSSRGPSAFGRLDPEVVAPGVNINSTSYTGNYTIMSGTSMATPHVSGAAALLLQKNHSLTPAEVRRILMHTASNLTALNIHVFEKGAGIINLTNTFTYNISATINGDDRWEESIIPGSSTFGNLVLSNNNSYPVNFSFSLEAITDLERDNSIPASSFALPDHEIVNAGSSKVININFTPPSDAKPAIYGTTIIVSNSTAGTIRIPMTITIPLMGSGSIQGTVNDDVGVGEYGDWIFYKIKSYNGTSLKVYLNWTDSNDDLDLILFAPNGVPVNYSTGGPGVISENLSLNNMVYDEYWAAVWAFSLSGTGSYFLNVSYPVGAKGNLMVTPSFWQDVVSNSEVKNITFSITNDATAKPNLNLSVKKRKPGGSNFSSGTIINTFSNYFIEWDVLSSGMNLNNTRYMNVTLQWTNSSNDLDLILGYYDGVQWWGTRFESTHNNSLLNESWEKLENVDVAHYLKNYPNFGIGIANSGSNQSYNLTINFTDIAPWSAAGVNLTQLSLGAGETRQVVVSINGSVLEQGKTYDAFFTVQNSTEDFASVPLRITTGGTTVNQCTNLNTPGYYTLTGSIMNSGTSPCIEITSSDVTFDGAGYTIDGFDSAGTYGLHVHNSTQELSNVTVKNARVTDWYYGIYYYNASNGSIANNTASSNDYGLTLYYSSNNTLSNNNASSNTYDGIALYYSSNNTLSNNNASSNSNNGLYLSHSSNNTLSNNNVTNNNLSMWIFGINLVSSSNNILSNNTASSNYYGIYLVSSSNNILSSNIAGSNRYEGFGLYYSSNNSLFTNNASNSGYGIVLGDSSNNAFSNNTALDNAIGNFYSYSNSTNNTVTNLSLNTATISFTSKDVTIRASAAPAGDPTSYKNLSRFINATNTSADSWLFLNVIYAESDVSGLNESLLRMWKHNGSWSMVPNSGVETSQNYVYANITSFSIFAPLAGSYGVNLTNITALGSSTIAGINTTYYLSLNNNGTEPDSYTLTVDNSDSALNADLNITSVYLNPGGTKVFTINVTNTTSGTYRVNVTARSNNDTSKFMYVNTTTIVLVVINITYPANNSVVINNFVNVTATLDNNGTARYLNWEGQNHSMLPDTSQPIGTVFYRNMAGLLSGNYSFKVYANGSDGILNVSETRTVTVSLTNTTNISAFIDPANGNLSSDVILVSPSGNVTVTIFNGTNVTENGTAPGNISIDSPARINATLTGYDRFAGENLTLGPSETRFIPDIQMRVNYTDAQLTAAGVSASTLRVKFYNTTTSSWVEQTPYTLNDTGKYILANVSHFSTFALIGTVPDTTTTTTISSSSGGGGGGGGASGENYSNIELKEKRDNYIFKDKVASYKFNTTDPIMYVNITGNISAGDVTTMVEVLRNTSTLVKNISAPGFVYKNMNIWVGTSGFATPKNIQKGVIRFRVLNSWLEDKKLTAGDVRLVKWDGSKWIELDTYETTKGSEHVYYEAVTDSFSPFAITAFRSDVPVEAVKTPVTANETQAPDKIETKREETSGLNGILSVTAVVLVIIVAILAAVYLREKKKI